MLVSLDRGRIKSQFYLGKNKIVSVQASINDLIELERQGLILIIKADEGLAVSNKYLF